jgi:hypothetical protein
MRRVGLSLVAILALANVETALAGVGLPRLTDLQAGPYTATLRNDSPSLVVGSNTLTLEMPSELDVRAVRLLLHGPHGQTIEVPLRPVAMLGGASDGRSPDAERHSEQMTDHSQPGAAGHDSTGPAEHGSVAVAMADGHGAPKPAEHGPVPVAMTDGHGVSKPAEHGSVPVAMADGHGVPKPAEHGSAAVAATSDHGTTRTNALPPAPDGHAASTADHGANDTALLRAAIDLPMAGSWRAVMRVADQCGEIHETAVTLDAHDGGPNRVYLAATGSLMVGALAVGLIGRRRAATNLSVR